jgi:hypothetical protein
MNWETGYGDWMPAGLGFAPGPPWLEDSLVLSDTIDEETHKEIGLARTILKRQIERATKAGIW